MTESDCNNYINGICILASMIFEKQIKCKKLFDCDFKRKLYNTSENALKLRDVKAENEKLKAELDYFKRVD